MLIFEQYKVFIVPLITLVATILMISGFRTSRTMWTAVALWILMGIISPEKGFSGFGSEAFITIALFMIFSAGLESSGIIILLLSKVLRRSNSIAGGLALMMSVCTALSCFLNNTLVVVTFMKPLRQWASRRGYSPSKFLMPLSYAATVGGICTLIGTSTNLVVYGIAKKFIPSFEMSFWEIGKIGFPIALLSIIYLSLGHRWLLPSLEASAELFRSARKYTMEFLVYENSEVIGRSIKDAGFRNLNSLFLTEIVRGVSKFIGPPPDFILQAGDQLIFSGGPESLAEVRSFKGIDATVINKLGDKKTEVRHYYEAIISDQSYLVNRTLKSVKFRENYGAVVLALLRNGEVIGRNPGTTRLLPGDMLLLDSERNLVESWAASPDFYLVSKVNQDETPIYRNSWKAGLVAILCFALASTSFIPIQNVALIGAMLMLSLRCVNFNEALRSMDKETLLVVAASLGLGHAWNASGLPDALANMNFGALSDNPKLLLIGCYLITVVLTEFLSNNAAGAIGVSLFMPVVQRLGLDPQPFVLAVMVGASASFMTDFGYQTNLMVRSIAGYKPKDFLRVGFGMQVICFAVVYVWTYYFLKF